jgi:site-specific recombinase XerD
MDLADIDPRAGEAVVRRGKGGKGRIVSFGSQTGIAIDRYLRARGGHRFAATPALWLGAKGSRVGDPDDWAIVRQDPRPPLVCPERGCDVELISYENPNNQYNPRIF